MTEFDPPDPDYFTLLKDVDEIQAQPPAEIEYDWDWQLLGKVLTYAAATIVVGILIGHFILWELLT